MDVILPYILVSAGLVLLYYGAEWLVDASSKLALRLGVSALIVGLTIVAFGTSAPELVVSIRSCLAGVGNISIGNVIGSNICNVALILGISAIIYPIHVSRQLFKFDIPVCLFIAIVSMLILYNGGEVKFWEGLLLLTLFALYIARNVFAAKKNSQSNLADAKQNQQSISADSKNFSVAKCIVFIILGLIALVVGADVLVRGAVRIAQSLGVSEAVIGLTIVAIGTSLPELATSIVAALKKHSDIAIGNVVGSNIFNLLLILGTVGVLGPTTAAGILPRDIWFMVVLAASLFIPLLTRRVVSRTVGILFASTYIAYIVVLCLQARASVNA